MKTKIPTEVAQTTSRLTEAGFQAYLVGGCVRDLIIGREPKDWDVATDALPEEIQKVFPDHVYENRFGTVAVKTGSEDPKLKIIEITTFRIEGVYTDHRHPDEVKFAKTIKEDLARRDFTVNAIAYRPEGAAKGEFVDPWGGEEDISGRVLRTVGVPEERFTEDALRLVRAVRFSIELDFELDMNTRRAIEKLAGTLEAIAKERIRDELIKILLSPRAAQGIILLEELDLLKFVLPELREGLGVDQNLHHIYTVFEHSTRALDYAAKEQYSLLVRLASLLHDIGKPSTKRGQGKTATFYGHEVVGAKMAIRALDTLHFPKDFIEQVAHLVRCHMFYYNVGEVTEAGVRRFLRRVGSEYVDDLMKIREADRIGSGVPKAVPYKSRHLLFMIDKVKADPISPKMLKMNGDDLMALLRIDPSPKVGQILAILLDEVLKDPSLNTKEYLKGRALELYRMTEGEMSGLASTSRERKEEFESGVEEEMKKKHHV
ncbi:MAG: HD domain-containing protein [Patescibacteria group bacterium]